jgi:hypothetical protein
MDDRRRMRRDDDQISTAEVARRLDRHEKREEIAHQQFARMINKLDERTDKINIRVTVIFSVVAVLWSIFLVIAPVLRGLLGLPSA